MPRLSKGWRWTRGSQRAGAGPRFSKGRRRQEDPRLSKGWSWPEVLKGQAAPGGLKALKGPALDPRYSKGRRRQVNPRLSKGRRRQEESRLSKGRRWSQGTHRAGGTRRLEDPVRTVALLSSLPQPRRDLNIL